MYQRDSRGWLKDEDIMRELRRIAYSSRHERQARRAPSMARIAAASGMMKHHIYSLLTSQCRLTDLTRQRLSIVLGQDE
jgi:hypothetical protein